VDILINAYPLQDVPSDFTIKVLNLALSRVGKLKPRASYTTSNFTDKYLKTLYEAVPLGTSLHH